MIQKEIKITLTTLTPLWTGDAWGDNTKIRPSSLMGSLRFWFYIYCKSIGLNTEKLNKKGVPSDNLEDYIKEYNKKSNTKENFESLIRKSTKEENFNFKNILDEIELPLISQLFGCTGWKSQIKIKDIACYESQLDKNSFDYKFLYKKLNSQTQSSEFWINKLLFDDKDKINGFTNITFDLIITEDYYNEFLKFLKFYEGKIILIGGKKSFGFGFCQISSVIDLSKIDLPTIKNNFFDTKQVNVSNLPKDKNVFGFNLKHYQRLKENKRFREVNFGKIAKASNFYFSMYLKDKRNDIYIISFKDNLDNSVFEKLVNKYSDFKEVENGERNY